MKDETDKHYRFVMDAIGATIERLKSELVLANYDKEVLEQKLKAAEAENIKLKASMSPLGDKETR
jgi:hypothetical protein